jgi:[ribosomal protein S5]-alanine N-acetyltransferase
MEIVGLRGDRVRLVPSEASLHLENAIRWMNDPEITNLLDLNWGVSRRQELDFFERIEARRDAEMHWALLNENDRHIGFIGLNQIDWQTRSATSGLMIGEKSVWGRGYGTDAIRTKTRFVFDELGLHRIEGQTMGSNFAMRKVYQKCGYRHEGTARKKRWRNGEWLDVELFAILEEDYLLTGKGVAGELVQEMPSG